MEMPPRARIVLGGTVGAMLFALVFSFSPTTYPELTPAQWFSIAFLLVLYLIADANLVPWHFSNRSVSFTASTGIDMALVLLYGSAVALPFVAIAVTAAEWHARRSPPKFLFNVGAAVLSTGAASLVFHSFGTVGASPFESGTQVLAWLLATAAHVLVNGTLLALMVSSVSRSPFTPLWHGIVSGADMSQWMQPPIGALIAILQLHSPWALVLAILPLFAVYMSYRRYLELNRQTRTALEAFADALDRRDPITFQHSQRVTQYVQYILQELDSVPLSEAETVITAARVHDLGKVGISDACLHKEGALDEAQWQQMKKHPGIGAQLLQPLSLYQESLPAVRHHHERWDGKGYPDGLAGDQIPFGARVLAVADAFDVMTSDRPYRRALGTEQALAEIEACKGTQFDPVIADAFIRALRKGMSTAQPGIVPVPIDY